MNLILTSFYLKIMEYQIWKRKNGSEIVLCNLKELLVEQLNVTSLLEARSRLNSSGEYAVKCPFCSSEGYEKEKLYIHEDLEKGYCFKCTRTYINVDDEIRYDIRIPVCENSSSVSLVKLNDPIWSLNAFENEFDEYDGIGYNYLVTKRHKFMSQLYKVLNIKFHDHNPVIPFYYRGELIYYQVRFIKSKRIKYFMPPISHKPIYSIEHGNNKKLIISEGVFDSIANLILYPDRTPISVLGSSVSDYQIEMIRNYCPEDIVIYMDETRISYNVKKKLERVINYCPISIIRSDGEDPEENLKKRIRRGYL